MSHSLLSVWRQLIIMNTYYVSVGRIEIFLILIVAIPVYLIIQVLYETSIRSAVANLFKVTIVCSLIFSIYLNPSDYFYLRIQSYCSWPFSCFWFLIKHHKYKVRSFISIGMVTDNVVADV